VIQVDTPAIHWLPAIELNPAILGVLAHDQVNFNYAAKTREIERAL